MVTIAASIVRQLWRAGISSPFAGDRSAESRRATTPGGRDARGVVGERRAGNRARGRRFWALSLAVAIAQIALSAPAGADIESALARRAQSASVYAAYAFPPPEVLLGADVAVHYEDALAKGGCIWAETLLELAFGEANPGAAPVLSDTGFAAWFEYVLPKHYPRLSFCMVMEDIASNQAVIDAGSFPDQPLRQRYLDEDPDFNRDSPVFTLTSSYLGLIYLAEEDYAPAQAELVRLSEAGRNIRLTPAYAWFLIERAKAQGFDAPDLATLAAAASARLSQEAREALSPMIEAATWPRGWPMVRD